MAIRPGQYNLLCPQGSTLNEYLSLKYSDGTAYPFNAAAMQVRETYASEEKIIDASTTNGKIIVNTPNAGDIQILVSAEETALIVAKDYVYDIEIYDTLVDPVVATRVLQGTFQVTPEVTR
jgi:hypothetical protein